ncbi:hypothetical protein RhiJN_02604 [Ceratobasidium sp. AG-Ba]|nr:hypothetical protein RhiJN_02604 [Ceratobasidium sp. AG-Ba]QRW02387.1 hypothetical protein RhiLY_01385 [Ceratobasidium sp. AG-Ba]
MPHHNASSLDDILHKERCLEHWVFLGDERQMEVEIATRRGIDRQDVVLKRALDGFVIYHHDKAESVAPWSSTPDYLQGVKVWGYAATIYGKEGLAAQTGLWFQGQIQYELVVIDRITSLTVESDAEFRNGERCLWLMAGRWKYALMSCFDFYSTLWRLTLAGYLLTPFKPLSSFDNPPDWWPEDKHDGWERYKYYHRLSKVPAVRRNALAQFQMWPNPDLFSSRPPLAPIISVHKLPVNSSQSKRTIEDAAEELVSGVSSGSMDIEPEHPSKRSRVHDSIMRTDTAGPTLSLGHPICEITTSRCIVETGTVWDVNSLGPPKQLPPKKVKNGAAKAEPRGRTSTAPASCGPAER